MTDASPGADDPTPPPSLSRTELAILRLVATGATNREIAHERSVTEATVKKHLSNVNGKLGTSNRTEAVLRAMELGLVDPPEREGAEPESAGDPEVARRLAEELERARRRSRRVTRAAIAAVAAAAALAIGYVAIAGGLGSEAAAPTPTPPADSPFWVPNRPLPAPRAGHALATVGGETYALGGAGETGPEAATLRLDLPRGWTALSDKPTPLRDVAAAVVQGRVIVPGGCDERGRAQRVVEVYDPAQDRWARAADLPEPVCGYGLADLDGQIFLFGGRGGPDATSASDRVLRFDPATDTWTELDDRLPDARADLAAVADDAAVTIHVVGGRDAGGEPKRNHWRYQPFAARNRWDTDGAPALPEGRAGHALALTRSPEARLILAAGGWDRRPEPGTLQLSIAPGAEASWTPSVEIKGQTPWRGTGLTVRGRSLLLAGGENGEGPMDQSYSYDPFGYRIVLPPAP